MSAVPDLIKLSQIPVNYASMVETSLLEPVVNRDGTTNGAGFCRFELERKGFLHSQSKLFVSLIPPAGVVRSYYPLNIGVGSVIQRATLKAGNQTLNEISDWSHLHVIKSALIDSETNVERELYTTGRAMNLKHIYSRSVAGPSTESSFPLAEGGYGIDTGIEYQATAVGNEGRDGRVPEFALVEGAFPGESPTYQIDLSDLFPFLKTHSLPLYMIDQPLQIEIVWAPQRGHRICLPAGNVDNQDFALDTTEIKFAADYIFYTDSDAMVRYADANPTIEFAFPDYRLSKSTLTVAQLREGVVRNLGMASRMVSRVLTTITNDALSNVAMTGKYNSIFPNRAATDEKPGRVVYNLRYNDRFEFPTSKTNPAELFTHFTQSEGVPFLTREMYSREQGGLSGLFTFEGHSQAQQLAGRSFMLATRLTNGRVGQRGIELHLTMGRGPDQGANQDMPVGTYTARSYCEYMRLARLSNGMFSVFNA
tara:strand:+ start:758 stop:2197 length:1440 start_codon:yes stop_codon:yes gene_type:complete